jgi:PTS system mannose-specific IID component
MTAAVSTRPAVRLPLRTKIDVFLRLLAIQGSWNYESLSGNGIAFCLEPALRLLPGGKNTPEFNAALARESAYFNAHPYLASIAVGALARLELEHEPPERIERFRHALCGPLGSVGDRLVWAGWLPFCSLVALAVFGLGGGPGTVVVTFLALYNVGHLWLRLWGLRTGWELGLRVAPALANPVFRVGPTYIGRVAAFATGLGLPLAVGRIIGPGPGHYLGEVLFAVVCGACVIVYLKGRIDGWKLSLVALAFFVLLSVIA